MRAICHPTFMKCLSIFDRMSDGMWQIPFDSRDMSYDVQRMLTGICDMSHDI
jgi:hypothetical protein